MQEWINYSSFGIAFGFEQDLDPKSQVNHYNALNSEFERERKEVYSHWKPALKDAKVAFVMLIEINHWQV